MKLIVFFIEIDIKSELRNHEFIQDISLKKKEFIEEFKNARAEECEEENCEHFTQIILNLVLK